MSEVLTQDQIDFYNENGYLIVEIKYRTMLLLIFEPKSPGLRKKRAA